MVSENHVTVSRIGDNRLVYKVRHEDYGNSKIRVLHQNMIMEIDGVLDNFDWNISISEKQKVKQKSDSPKTSNKKTIVQRTDSNEETVESDEEVNSSSSIKELRTKIFFEIEKEPRINNYTKIEREPRIKNFIHIENPNLIYEEKQKSLFKGSLRESSKEAGSNRKSGKTTDEGDILNLQKRRIEGKEKEFKGYDLRSKKNTKVQQISSSNKQKLEREEELKLRTCITGKEKDG